MVPEINLRLYIVFFFLAPCPKCLQIKTPLGEMLQEHVAVSLALYLHGIIA